jgi:arsenate reductase
MVAEAVGTCGLACAVVGSGIAAERLSPGEPGLQLLQNTLATTLALGALILALGGVSGAHFNPLVSAVEALRRRVPPGTALAFVAAQVVGGLSGTALAHGMFGAPALEASPRPREGAGLLLGEAVAAAGLLLVLHGTAASRPRAVPLAVAAYVGAAYWFTSSTAFANPAVTLARSLTPTFAGIAPSSVPAFVAAQAVGAAAAVALLVILLPGFLRARHATQDAGA